MKLWKLGEREGRHDDVSFSYDDYHGFVIRAETEADAREAAKMASLPSWYEEEDIEEFGFGIAQMDWLDHSATFCVEIPQEGKPEVILYDYKAG